MVTYYIATSLSRSVEHNRVRDALEARGHEITYDWTVHGDAKKYESVEALSELGTAMVDAVAAADVVVVLLPGGGGTHVELGVALLAGKPVVIHSEVETPFRLGSGTKAFYHCPSVTQVVSPVEDVEAVVEAFEQCVESAVF